AFIRAYDGDTASSAVAASPLRRSSSSATAINPPATVTESGHSALGGVTTAAPGASLANGSLNARITEVHQAHAAAIHVGMGAIIPPPHVKFGANTTYSHSSTAASSEIPSQIAPSVGDALTSTARSALHQKLMHADFGRSPKAALSSFTQ